MVGIGKFVAGSLPEFYWYTATRFIYDQFFAKIGLRDVLYFDSVVFFSYFGWSFAVISSRSSDMVI